MKTLKVYGASDDLIEIDGLNGRDEFGAYPKGNYAGYMALRSRGVCVHIHAIYDGSWAFAVCPQDGDYEKSPDWPIRRTFGADVPYSETLEIDVPDDAVIEWVGRK